MSELEVSLLLTMIGPLNSEATLLSDPPSTLSDLDTLISVAAVTFNPGSSLISSPVTVATGVLIISSLPVAELNLLFPL